MDRAGYLPQLKPSRQELDLLDPAAVQQYLPTSARWLCSLRKSSGIQANTAIQLIFFGEPQDLTYVIETARFGRRTALVGTAVLHLPEVRRAADQGGGAAYRWTIDE